MRKGMKNTCPIPPLMVLLSLSLGLHIPQSEHGTSANPALSQNKVKMGHWAHTKGSMLQGGALHLPLYFLHRCLFAATLHRIQKRFL